MTLPTLYKKTSTGAIQEWTISCVDSDSPYGDGRVALLTTVYGQVGGAKQTAVDAVSAGKNAGRSNETTYLEQGLFEAQSQWEKKKKKGYVESVEDAKAGIIDAGFILGGADPMLAKKYSEHGHKISFPCYVQPKLDGHRCIAIVAGGKCTLWSRTRKPITGLPHIQRALEAIYGQDVTAQHIFDGELYNHDYRDKFEKLSSHIRRQTPKDGYQDVQYWIYDKITDGPFKARIGQVENSSISFVNKVETQFVWTEDELLANVALYISEGFEGGMARNADSFYVGKRSEHLQKIKFFDDDEFEIVGVETGRGKMSDKGVFVCATKEGAEFKAKLVGKLDDLRDIADNPDNYIGERLTVKYQGFSEDGIPRFPVGIRIREDL